MLFINDVNKTYTNGVTALNSISLSIPSGIFGLLGPNGAGKSSLMRTLATLQLPDSGTIKLEDINVLEQPEAARKKIGYLPQDFGLYPNVTAENLLDQFALYKGIIDKSLRKALVKENLNRVNLYQNKDQNLGGFSGGMRQRFGIAQALLCSPSLLIVDEPTAGLDPAERLRLQGLLAELAEDRVVLLSTHLVEDVLALCSHIAIMKQGSIVCSGETDNLMKQLEGRVWGKDLTQASEIKPDWALLSSRMVRGKRLVRVYAEEAPDQDFNVCPVDLDDVYFRALNA